MIQVDADKFRWLSALEALDHGLAEVEASEEISDALKQRFRKEAGEWRSALETASAGDAEIAQAWGPVHSQSLRLLDLVLEADDETWAGWRDDASDAVETLGAFLAVPQTSESSDLVAPNTDAVELVGAAEVYAVDLPDTPAGWRALSLLRQIRAERLSDLDTLIASIRRTVVSSTRQRMLTKTTVLPKEMFAPAEIASAEAPKALLAGGAAYERILGVGTGFVPDLLANQLTRYNSIEFPGLNSYIAEIGESVVPAKVRGNVSSKPGARRPFAVDVLLEDAGQDKFEVIKAIRGLTSLGLGEAKAIVDHGSRSVVLEGVSDEVAATAKAALERAGATVALRAVVSGNS